MRVYPNPNGKRQFEKDIHGIRKVLEKRYIVRMDQDINIIDQPNTSMFRNPFDACNQCEFLL